MEISETGLANSKVISSVAESKDSGSTGKVDVAIKQEDDTGKKIGGPKAKKRKKSSKDAGAPKLPLNGYVRYLTERREQCRVENPNMPFTEITKVLAAEWSALAPDKKQLYLTAAEQDKERYLQEMTAYKQTEAYRIFSERRISPKTKDEKNDTVTRIPVPENIENGLFDIPIFTESFLDHNKEREAELRQLRKSTTEYEQQNATIQTYVASMRSAVEKLKAETQQREQNNAFLKQHLLNLRNSFATILTSITIPGIDKPTADNVEACMPKVLTFVKDNPTSTITTNLRKAVSELDLQA